MDIDQCTKYGSEEKDWQQELYELKKKHELERNSFEAQLLDLEQELNEKDTALCDLKREHEDQSKSERTRIEDLLQQNGRLVNELKKLKEKEEKACVLVTELERQVNDEREQRIMACNQLNLLQNEFQLIDDRNKKIDDRIAGYIQEKAELQAKFDTAQTNLLVLEKENCFLRHKLTSAQQEIYSLKQENDSLSVTNKPSPCLSDFEEVLALKNGQLSVNDELEELDEVDEIAPFLSHSKSRDEKDLAALLDSLHLLDESVTTIGMHVLEKGVLCRKRSSSSGYVSGAVYTLTLPFITEFTELILEKSALVEKKVRCGNHRRESLLESSQEALTVCEQELESARQEAAMLRIGRIQLQDDIQRARSDLLSVTSEMAPDERVTRIMEQREQAIGEKQELERCLARKESECRKLERQLMRTIEQKVQVQQQVELWQLDVSELVEDSVKLQERVQSQTEAQTIKKTTNWGTSWRSLFKKAS